jgi:hypothetical protein
MPRDLYAEYGVATYGLQLGSRYALFGLNPEHDSLIAGWREEIGRLREMV